MQLRSVLSAIILSIATVAFARPPRYAVVNLSVNYLRERPEYEEELGTQALMGTIVEILDQSGYWYKVLTDEPYTAWCTKKGLVEMSSKEIEDYINAPKYICTAWHSTLYTLPDQDSQKICDLVEGDVMRTVPQTGFKAMFLPFGKFVRAMLPDGTIGYVLKGDVEDYSEWKASRNPTGDSIIAEAMKFMGLPYLWGGTSPNGVDCSGLVRHVFLMNGISLPRNASQQARVGKPVGKAEEAPSIDMLQKGDLLFFGTYSDEEKPKISHVGIYIGDGRFIHSSHYVRINSIDRNSADYFEKRLLFAKRIL